MKKDYEEFSEQVSSGMVAVHVYENEAKASFALAKQLHEDAVKNGEALETDWRFRGYQAGLISEAKFILRQKGESGYPNQTHHVIIRVK